MLSFQMERLRRARQLDVIVVATTTNLADEPIVEFCAREGIECTRGSEIDVLSRYYEAAMKLKADAVVRVTSDCPLLDPDVIDRVVSEFSSGPECFDYASNMIQPTFPYGMAVEVMSFRTLTEAHEQARDPSEREHVTPFIYWRPERYRIRSVAMSPDLSRHRWTVDTLEDFLLVSRILEALYPVKPDFRMADLLALLESHPDWEEMNRHVPQNVVTQNRQVQ
jgi:spore coat polysaccharide biosynthesis protein SpsF